VNGNEFHIKQYANRKEVDLFDGSLFLYIDNEVFAYSIFPKNSREPHKLYQASINKEVNNYRPLEERIRFLLANNPELSSFKGKTHVTVLNDRFTLFPNAFNNSDHARSMLSFTSGVPVLSLKRDNVNDICFAYTIEKETLQLIESSFKNAMIRHSSSVTTELFSSMRSLKKCEVFLNFSENKFEIVARKNEQLVYYNVFDFENKDDVLYYVLFMMEQYGFDPEISRVGIAGNVEAAGELMLALKKYIRFITFAVNDIQVPQSVEWNFPNHFYFSVLNRRLCAS
jgi:hypothetical protein